MAVALKHLKEHPWTEAFFIQESRPVHYPPIEDQQVPVLSLDSKDPRILQAKEESELELYGVSHSFIFFLFFIICIQ